MNQEFFSIWGSRFGVCSPGVCWALPLRSRRPIEAVDGADGDSDSVSGFRMGKECLLLFVVMLFFFWGGGWIFLKVRKRSKKEVF